MCKSSTENCNDLPLLSKILQNKKEIELYIFSNPVIRIKYCNFIFLVILSNDNEKEFSEFGLGVAFSLAALSPSLPLVGRAALCLSLSLDGIGKARGKA